MDRATMVTRVRRRLGEDTADFWSDDDIVRALEDAIRAFAHEEDWSWLSTYQSISFAANANNFPLPADVDVTRTVAMNINLPNTDPYPLERVTSGDGFRMMSEYRTASDPQWYFVYSTVTGPDNAMVTTLRLVPPARAAGTIDMLYYRRPAALAAATTEPDIPEDYHDGIVAKATADLWLHELDVSGVKYTEQISLYREMLARAQMHEGKLGDSEQLAIGKGHDEAERAGMVGPFRLPSGYGWPQDTWL